MAKIPIKVINLEGSHERRIFMEEQLARLELKYEFVNAVDGRNLSEKDLEKYSIRDSLKSMGRELSNGEIACALSHIKIWNQLIDEKIERVLVLEDDALIGKALLGVLNCIESFPEDWEYINFVTDWKLIPFGKPIHDIYRMARIKGTSNRSTVYLINYKGAEKLLKAAFPIRMPVDNLVGRTKYTDLRIYSIHPQVASFYNFESDIWKITNRDELRTTLSFKLKKVCRKIIHLLQRLKNRY